MLLLELLLYERPHTNHQTEIILGLVFGFYSPKRIISSLNQRCDSAQTENPALNEVDVRADYD